MQIVDCSSEFEFIASRSSGAGGQNVNKVNTKVELRFNITQSTLFSDCEKALLVAKLSSKITDDGMLCVRSQESRSQLQNKELCVQKFYELISKALTIKKKRTPTKPTFASKQVRLQKKKVTSEIKKMRKPPQV